MTSKYLASSLLSPDCYEVWKKERKLWKMTASVKAKKAPLVGDESKGWK